jgi:hypothetical protein
MIKALQLFKDEHGNLPVALTNKDDNFDKNGVFETVDKFSISMCKIGRKKQIVISEIFNK